MSDTMLSVLELVNSHLDAESRNAVVRTAIQVGLDNRGTIAAGFFFDEIDSHIRIKGFRRPSVAPLNLLTRAVAERLPRSPSLALSAITLWAMTRTQLSAAVLDVIHEAGVATGFDEIPQDLSVTDVEHAVREALKALRGRQTDAADDELWLVLLAVMYFDFESTSCPPLELGHDESPTTEADESGPATGDGSKGQEATLSAEQASEEPSHDATDSGASDGFLSSLFAGWISELEVLDSRALEWTEADEFAERVRQLAGRKRDEAERGRSAELALDLLDIIRSRHAETLAVFGRVLRVDIVPDGEDDWLIEATSEVGALRSLLDEYADLLALPAPRLLAERKDRRRAEEELEARIGEVLEALPTRLWNDDQGPDDRGTDGKTSGSDAGMRIENGDAPSRPDAETGTGSSGPEDETPSLSGPEASVEPVVDDQASGGGSVEDTSQDKTSEHSDSAGGSAVVEEAETGDDDLAGTQQDEIDAGLDHGTPQELAERLIAHSDQAALAPLVAGLVAGNDTPAAYWITRSMEERRMPVQVPSWLLAAYQGSVWLTTDSALAWDLKSIVTANPLNADETCQLLALAASLKSVLVEPETGMAAWLQDAAPAAARFGLLDLSNAVRKYADQCPMAIRPEYLVGITDEAAREDAIQVARAEAASWMERAQLLKAGYQRATAVWRRLVSKNGDIAEFMEQVLRDNRSAVANVRAAADLWSDGEHVDRRVAELVDQMYGGGAHDIEAHAAVWLRRRAAETCNHALHWCQLAEQAGSDSRNVAWVSERIEELRRAVADWLAAVPQILGELSCGSGSRDRLACACLKAIAGELAILLRLDGADGVSAGVAVHECGTSWWTSDASTIDQMLARRLLWCPELALERDCLPSREAVVAAGEVMLATIANGRTLSDATRMWASRQRDFRFLDKYLVGGLSPLVDDEAFVEEMHDLQDEALAELREAAGLTVEALEQAVVDNVLEEVERATFDSQLQQIVAPLTGDGPLESSYNVGRRLEELAQLRAHIDGRRTAHLEHLSARWLTVRKAMLEDYPSVEARPVIDLVEKAFRETDTVLLNECVPELERTVDKKAGLEPERFIAPEHEDVLAMFNASREAIRSWATGKLGLRGVLTDIEAKRQKAGLTFGALSDPMHKEVLRAVTAWRQLKRHKGSQEEARKQLPALVQYLGFEPIHVGSQPVTVKAAKADWLHAVFSMTAGDRARPIPLFGSKSNNRYDVVCLWERPGMVSLGSRIQELGIKNRAVLVLYMGHLSDLQRLELAQGTRARRMPVAVLDETLLLFLSRCRNMRLSDFLACAIPYAALNPYTPGVAGNVPPEMYYGREHMADELENQHGSCLVYGGRQLGKSALLRRVAARFHRPGDEQYAEVHEIKLVGDRLAGEESSGIWRHLHEAMSNLDLVDRKYKGPEDLGRRIRQVMEAVPERRVIIMFDEADNFLHDDSRGNYSQLTRLKSLMEDTDRRFKLVFAGLQEVQRFKQLPNHPLAHLGEPILVGALEPNVARRLVRGPADVLGYRMSNPVVLRILSYTNYHPGLLQLFCYALIERLQKRAIRTLPPYEVMLEDVETVFRQDLRKEIRKRFDWTLELDPRYQAIAWSMIADQLEQHDGYSRGYTPRQIFELASAWWASGFDDVQDDGMGALLTELCGLNILVEERVAGGSRLYRLRSPNLVRLMGTGEDLETRLLELGGREDQGRPVDLSAIRLWIDGPEESGFFSPLTRAQEAQVAKPEFGVSVIHGSSALGLGRAEAAVRALVPRDLPAAEFAVGRVPETARTGEAMRRWLREFVRRHREQHRLFAWTVLGAEHATVAADVVEGAIAFCESKRGDPKQWLRVVVFLDPVATRSWMEAEPVTRQELEQRADVVTWLRPLTATGVVQHLNRFDMISSPEACDAILDATGGWTLLVDRCIEDARANDSTASAQRLKQALLQKSSDLRDDFVEASGLRALGEWQGVVKALYGWLPEYEREVATLTAEDLNYPAWRSQESITLLRRLSYVRLQSDGRLGPDVVLARLTEK